MLLKANILPLPPPLQNCFSAGVVFQCSSLWTLQTPAAEESFEKSQGKAGLCLLAVLPTEGGQPATAPGLVTWQQQGYGQTNVTFSRVSVFALF